MQRVLAVAAASVAGLQHVTALTVAPLYQSVSASAPSIPVVTAGQYAAPSPSVEATAAVYASPSSAPADLANATYDPPPPLQMPSGPVEVSAEAASTSTSAPPQAPKAPPAGALVQRVRGKLFQEHQVLGSISQELLQVTGAVDAMEREVLGHVIDGEDAKGLAAKHEVLDASNERARDDLRKLNLKIQQTSSELAVAQRTYVSEGKKQEVEEASLRQMLAEQQLVLEAQAQQKAGVAFLSKATRKNDDLRKGLEEVQLEIQREIQEQDRLRKALVDVHQYGLTCHERTLELQQEVIKLAKKAQPTSHSITEEVIQKQAKAAAKATLQRFQAEGALLRAEIQSKENMAHSALSHLKGAQDELSLLQNHIIGEVHSISEKMNVTKNRTSFLEEAIQNNIAKADEDMGRRRGLENDLQNLQKRLSPIVMSALQAENEALQREFNGAQFLLEQSKAAEARSFSVMAQMTAEVNAQENASRIVQHDAEAQKQAAEQQLKEAIEESMANKAKAEAQQASALSVINLRCGETWDKINKTKSQELATCRRLADELTIASAQQNILEQSLRAQETAETAVQGEEETTTTTPEPLALAQTEVEEEDGEEDDN